MLIRVLIPVGVLVAIAGGVAGGYLLLPRLVSPGSGSRCADLVAQALASPHSQVKGSWRCIDANLQKQVTTSAKAGSGDAALERLALGSGLAMTSAHYAFKGKNGSNTAFNYALAGRDPLADLYVVVNSKSGLVVDFGAVP